MKLFELFIFFLLNQASPINDKCWSKNIHSVMDLFLNNREISFVAQSHKNWPIFFGKIDSVKIKMKDDHYVSASYY